MRKKYLLFFVVLFSTMVSAQTYSISMSNPVINTKTMQYTFTVFMQSLESDFQIGGSNIRFDFNNAGLSSASAPVFKLSLGNGSFESTSGILGKAPNKFANIAWANATSSGPVITSKPVEIGIVTMDIIDASQLAGLQFRFSAVTKEFAEVYETTSAITSSKVFKMDNTALLADLSTASNLKTAPLSITKVTKVSNVGKKISIFPNPANDQFTISIPKEIELGSNTVINIQDISGRILTTKYINVNNNNLEMDVHTLANGNYLINIINDNGLNTVEKFVVQH
jgi:hypothetical protein